MLQLLITKTEEKLNVINFCKKFLEQIVEKYRSNTQSSIRRKWIGPSVKENTFRMIEEYLLITNPLTDKKNISTKRWIVCNNPKVIN